MTPQFRSCVMMKSPLKSHLKYSHSTTAARRNISAAAGILSSSHLSSITTASNSPLHHIKLLLPATRSFSHLSSSGRITSSRFHNNNSRISSKCPLQSHQQHRTFLNSLFSSSDNNSSSSSSATDNNTTIFDDERILGFSPRQIYDVVVDIDKYREFVPHIQDSYVSSEVKVLDQQQNQESNATSSPQPTKQMSAVLKIQFAAFEEQYESLVTFQRDQFVRAEALNTPLFDSLVNEWRLTPVNDGKATRVDFSIRFKFSNQLYQMVAQGMMPKLVEQMTSSFEERCKAVYGEPSQQTELCHTEHSAREFLANQEEEQGGGKR